METSPIDGHIQMVVRMPRSLSDLKLPPGWIGVNHKSGGIVYLHKESRVATWSRPYFLGKEVSLRKHDIPLASIPCLYQKLKTVDKNRLLLKRKLDHPSACTTPEKQQKHFNDGHHEELKDEEILSTPLQVDVSNENPLSSLSTTPQTVTQAQQVDGSSITSSPMSCPASQFSISYSESHERTQLPDQNLETIAPQTLHNYLSEIFQFDLLSEQEARNVLFTGDEVIEMPQVNVQQNQQNQSEQPSMKKKTKITIEGKTPIQILNEYCQRELQAPMKFMQINTSLHADFIVEVLIGDLKYGIGAGDTLKQAKHKAAQITLDILEPSLTPRVEGEGDKFKAFDELPVETMDIFKHKDLYEGVSQPYEILIKLLKRKKELHKTLTSQIRYFTEPAFSRSEIHIDVEKIKEHTYKYEMKCRHFISCGVAMKRKHCKQMGAQSIIQQLYPALHSWGSALRLGHVTMPEVTVAPSPKKGEPAPSRSEVLIHALKNEMKKMSSPNKK